MTTIDWRKYIHSNPEVLLGKPVVRGTRLSVEFILGLFAEGWTELQVIENYPTLTREHIRAVFVFATECMREESFCAIPTEIRIT
ncbi:MAG: hypothetical protein BroJett041_23180 [Candidatus Jettenia caeni]|nr:DUF433 domain-containing protein [Candidatus Jettenia sp. AMX1]WKZ14253.1 MAG: DUF433 domain-containing protein [Candidatus Jettenia caeni]GIL21204.1 MAG: hypothetical protein BroJett041_23180 [Candidatus Jettenia caeni]GJQ44782.1 MAG: hypothetical protein JETCAE04_05360 [Candidatus Jettenia caeni]